MKTLEEEEIRWPTHCFAIHVVGDTFIYAPELGEQPPEFLDVKRYVREDAVRSETQPGSLELQLRESAKQDAYNYDRSNPDMTEPACDPTKLLKWRAADRIAELEALLDIFKRGHIGFNREITDDEAQKAYAALQKGES